MKRFTQIGLVVILILLAAYIFIPSPKETATDEDEEATVATADYKNIQYTIEDESVNFVNGFAESQIDPDPSIGKVTTRYFGNEVRKDLNGDGREDIAFLVTQNSGGTGTFFYVVAAVSTESGYAGSHGYFLGDRIAPQTTESGEGDTIIVNFADRRPEESFATPPSVAKSVSLHLNLTSMKWEERTDLER